MFEYSVQRFVYYPLFKKGVNIFFLDVVIKNKLDYNNQIHLNKTITYFSNLKCF